MIARTFDEKEIARFFNALQELASVEMEENYEKSSLDGELLSPYPSTEWCSGKLGNWGSAAINKSTTPIGYETHSGLGICWIAYEPNGEPGSPVTVLYFAGRRNSFKSGCGYLGFYPSPEANWEVVASQQPDRGAFD